MKNPENDLVYYMTNQYGDCTRLVYNNRADAESYVRDAHANCGKVTLHECFVRTNGSKIIDTDY